MAGQHSLDNLRLADPEAYVWVKGRVDMLQPPPSDAALALLVQETIWGLSQEAGMGAAMARGLLALLPADSQALLQNYLRLVHRAAETGVTLGRIVAEFSASVVLKGQALTDLFEKTMAVMLGKGTYALTAPFEALRELLDAGDTASGAAYLELLAETFKQELTYNQSLQLVYRLPKAVRNFTLQRRRAQIEQFKRVVQADLQLVDPFLDGLDKGAGLLDEEALSRFLSLALARYASKPDLGMKFLSLSSKVGQDTCLALQRAVPLSHVNSPLGRYLYARLGRPVGVLPLSGLTASAAPVPWVCSDGQSIYLPDEVARFKHREQNIALFKDLARLEAAFFECRTFDFDLERAAEMYPGVLGHMSAGLPAGEPGGMCDGERFVHSFSYPLLAADLFSLFEQARVTQFLHRWYPGLIRHVLPLLEADLRPTDSAADHHLLTPVIARLLVGQDFPFSENPLAGQLQRELVALFDPQSDAAARVEGSARLVCVAHDRVTRISGLSLRHYMPAPFPYGRRLHWEMVSRAQSAHDRIAMEIKRRLEARQIKVYRSDLRKHLADGQGPLSSDDVAALVLSRAQVSGQPRAAVHLTRRELETLLRETGMGGVEPATGADDAFRYPEWDDSLQDYLADHTRVREIAVAGQDRGTFYRNTLVRHGGLVSRMRRAFAFLKPQAMAILRQWPEGDDFDYRALLDYAMDRRAGRMPSDRLFIKRLKQARDVAVLLLVDLSRSTANPVAGGHASVLDVTKEALVLFCEALQVVGDPYAIAGFSGTGRHAVDFFQIKTFKERLADKVRSRIAWLAPQRSTRMGAAIRHATTLLTRMDSRVRLMILISDGFPNDLGYKSDYAVADTRQAIQEARSSNVHVKAITVNIGSDPGLDALYGRVHHHVIGDVRELPDKLLRLYGTLTRF